MSINNLLTENNYNIYSNSITLKGNDSDPVPSVTTLWINSTNNHLYRDNIDLENVIPGPTILNNKGDLLTHNNISDEVLPVGTNGQVLTANSAATNGIEWTDIPDQIPLTTKGDLLSFSTIPDRLPVGTNDQILTADSTQTFGMAWKNKPSYFTNALWARGFPNSNISLANNTNVQITWGTTFGPSTLTTIPRTGLYLFNIRAAFDANATGSRQLIFALNTVVFEYIEGFGSANSSTDLSFTFLYQCQANDTINIYARQSSGGNLNLLAGGLYGTLTCFSWICLV